MADTRVILIHGLGCSREDWSAQLDHLTQAADVIALDLPGHGQAEPAHQTSINAMAMSVNAARRSAPPARTVLVGHSLGCRVVLEAARRQREGLVGLVLIEGSQRAIGDVEDAGQRDRHALSGENRAALLQGFLDMFTDRTPDDFRELAIRRMKKMNPTYIAELVAEMTRWDAEDAVDAMTEVSAPVLVIQSTFKSPGQRRRPIKASEMSPWLQSISKHVPGAEIIWLRGLGHFPQVEAPEVINSLLGTFIERLRIS